MFWKKFSKQAERREADDRRADDSERRREPVRVLLHTLTGVYPAPAATEESRWR